MRASPVKDEIDQCRILVVVDASKDALGTACPLLVTDATHLPLHAHPEVLHLAVLPSERRQARW